VQLSGRAPRFALAAAILVAVVAAPHASGAPVPTAAQSPQYEVPLKYLTPIPVVRLVGRTTRTGARVTLLRIRAPRGSDVTVKCSGGRRKGCPFGRKTRRTPASHVVRFREVERRLKAGVRLDVFVLRGETIGKHTRFIIRRHRAPSRTDDCLLPGDPFEPAECP
jgi:hypothetical protein